jgi:hypothetical protein
MPGKALEEFDPRIPCRSGDADPDRGIIIHQNV